MCWNKLSKTWQKNIIVNYIADKKMSIYIRSQQQK